MKRLLILPALAVGLLLWACDGNSPAEPEVSADQTELMNFVNTPAWPDMNGNGLFCAEDLGGDLIQKRCIFFTNKPAVCHTNVTCRDDNLKPGDLNITRCIYFVDKDPVCIGPCGAKFDLVRPEDFDPSDCNGGPPQG